MKNFLIKVAAYTHGIWVHRWSTLGITAITALAGWLLVNALPELYQSKMSVYVEYKNYSDKSSKDLEAILFNKSNLKLINDKSTQSRINPPSTDIGVNQLRHNLNIISDNTAGKTPLQETLDINYSSTSPEHAFHVANTIVNLLTQEMTSTDQENLNLTSNGINVRVLEYPQKPVLPHHPNRKLLLSVSALIAIITGVLWGITRYRFSPVFSDYRQLRKRIKLPVLGVVNLHKSPEMLKQQKLDILAFSLACIGVLILTLLAITHH